MDTAELSFGGIFLKSHHDSNERLKTFKDWPFRDNCNCTPEAMAEAGFVFIGTSKEPDLVACFYCQRELDGWEPQDIPMDEHKRRECPFVNMNKKPKDLSVEDWFILDREREIALLRNRLNLTKENFKTLAKENYEKMTAMIEPGKQTKKKTTTKKKGRKKY